MIIAILIFIEVSIKMIKNLIVADRQTGKTRHLMTKCSQDEYSIIVCPNRMMCEYVFEEARNMGLKIPIPINFSDFTDCKFNPRNVNKFYFDELQMSLGGMANGVPIDKAVIGFNEDSNLYAVGNYVNRKETLYD